MGAPRCFFKEGNTIPKIKERNQTDKVKGKKKSGKPAQASAQTTRAVPAGQLTVGMDVTVNGKFYYSSQGAEPHGTFSGYRGKISRIAAGDPQRPCPYHITAPDGAAKGWVARGQLQAVDR